MASLKERSAAWGLGWSQRRCYRSWPGDPLMAQWLSTDSMTGSVFAWLLSSCLLAVRLKIILS